MSCESQWAWHGAVRCAALRRCNEPVSDSPICPIGTRYRYTAIYTKTMRGDKCLTLVVCNWCGMSLEPFSTIFGSLHTSSTSSCPNFFRFLSFSLFLFRYCGMVDCVFRWLAGNAREWEQCLIWSMERGLGITTIIIIIVICTDEIYIVRRPQQIKHGSRRTWTPIGRWSGVAEHNFWRIFGASRPKFRMNQNCFGVLFTRQMEIITNLWIFVKGENAERRNGC